MTKKNILIILAGVILVGIIQWYLYQEFCVTVEKICWLADFDYVIATFFVFSLALVVPLCVALITPEGGVYKWIKWSITLIATLSLWITLAPEFVNIGNPMPEKGIATIWSGFFLAIWSIFYLLYQSYKMRNNKA